jgi:hypothetical protein
MKTNYFNHCFCRSQKISNILFVIVLFFGFDACKSVERTNQSNKLEKLEHLMYKFTDSSTSPRFHRSYSLVVSMDSIVLTVASYSDILGNKTYPLPKNGINKIQEALAEHKIAIQDKVENDGCSGGTSKSISYRYEGDVEQFAAYAYFCGGSQYGTLSGDVEGFFEVLRSYAPDLSEFVKSTRK